MMHEQPSVRELLSGSPSFPSQNLAAWEMEMMWLRKELHDNISPTWNSSKPSDSSDFPKK